MTPDRIDLDALERLAQAATPGPWKVYGPWPTVSIYVDDPAAHQGNAAPQQIAIVDRRTPLRDVRDHPDAAFVAAVNPHAILTLIAELRAARAVVAAARLCVKAARAVQGKRLALADGDEVDIVSGAEVCDDTRYSVTTELDALDAACVTLSATLDASTQPGTGGDDGA